MTNEQEINHAFARSLSNVGLGMNDAQEDCTGFGDAMSDVFECDPKLKEQMIESGLINPNVKVRG